MRDAQGARGRWIRGLLIGATVALLVAVVDAAVAEACPGCKAALANGGSRYGNLVSGYFWSILFMMSMPFLLLGSIGSYFWWEVRRAQAERDAAQAAPPPVDADPNK